MPSGWGNVVDPKGGGGGSAPDVSGGPSPVLGMPVPTIVDDASGALLRGGMGAMGAMGPKVVIGTVPSIGAMVGAGVRVLNGCIIDADVGIPMGGGWYGGMDEKVEVGFIKGGCVIG